MTKAGKTTIILCDSKNKIKSLDPQGVDFPSKDNGKIKEQLDTYGINKSQVYFDLEKTIDYEKNRIIESCKKRQSECLHEQNG